MNRSALIVICDFLLVSLLAFSSFNPPARESAPPTPTAAPAQNEDMVSTLRLALDDERDSRERLASELARTRASVETQQDIIARREMEIQRHQAQLRAAETEARQLDDQRTTLLQQMSHAQTNLTSIQRALNTARSEVRLSQEQMQGLQSNLEKQQATQGALREQLAKLELNHSNVMTETMQLNTKLQVAEAEKRLAAQQVHDMRSEVQIIRAEKAELQATTQKLAEKISTLAEKSTAIVDEMRDHRPRTANALFHEFTQSRIAVEFTAAKPGVLGQSFKRETKFQSILLTDGKQTYALGHISDMPLGFTPPEADWASLHGILSRGTYSYPVARLTFLEQDARVVLMPVPADQIQTLGSKIYEIAPDPFLFQDAVLVGAKEGYYGECRFEIDPATPGYVRMDRSLFRGLFGKFNPSQGDLVLSKTGQVLGIMANNDYCAVLGQLVGGAPIPCGEAYLSRETQQLLAQLQKKLTALPMKLQ